MEWMVVALHSAQKEPSVAVESPVTLVLPHSKAQRQPWGSGISHGDRCLCRGCKRGNVSAGQGCENWEQHICLQGRSLCSISTDFQHFCCNFALAPALDPFPQILLLFSYSCSANQDQALCFVFKCSELSKLTTFLLRKAGITNK